MNSVSWLSAKAEIERVESDGTIGIITGSGPEAGIDLWSKILSNRRESRNLIYRGDLDAPAMRIRSIPTLGLSMDMDTHASHLRPLVTEAALEMAQQCAAYTIACNTLHFFARELETVPGGTFVSVQSVVRDELAVRNESRFALLGAKPVMSLGEWSPYSELQSEYEIETADSVLLDQLIYAVKSQGGASPEIAREFRAILDSLESTIVVVGCTELPLLFDHRMTTRHQLIDVTDLLAIRLLQKVGLKQ